MESCAFYLKIDVDTDDKVIKPFYLGQPITG